MFRRPWEEHLALAEMPELGSLLDLGRGGALRWARPSIGGRPAGRAGRHLPGGYLDDVEVPGHGTARVVTNVARLSDTPGAESRRPPPGLGEHTAEVMAELGFTAEEVERVLAMGDGAAETLIDLVHGDG